MTKTNMRELDSDDTHAIVCALHVASRKYKEDAASFDDVPGEAGIRLRLTFEEQSKRALRLVDLISQADTVAVVR